MKLLSAFLFSTALISAPAMACGFGKTANYDKPMQSASVKDKSSHSAMSTYDPASKPVYEEKAEATTPKKPETAEPVTE